MSVLPIQKKLLLGTFALATVLVPIVFGASAGASKLRATRDGGAPILVRINPNTRRGARRKLEGEVNLEFTIAANGTTKDVVVVESTAEFEAPAIAALLKWRYLPTNVECVGAVCTPIETHPPSRDPDAHGRYLPAEGRPPSDCPSALLRDVTRVASRARVVDPLAGGEHALRIVRLRRGGGFDARFDQRARELHPRTVVERARRHHQ